jgi:hypothetical protein
MTKSTKTPVSALPEIKSAKAIAQAYAKAKTKAARTEIRDYVAATSKTSKRIRWQHLLADIDAGDVTRVSARATGNWSKVTPKVASTDAPAKPKATKAKAKPANDMGAMVAEMASWDDTQMAAFFAALTAATAK